MFLKSFFCFLWMGIASSLCGQSLSTARAVEDDLSYLMEALKLYCPSLYAYYPEKDLQAHLIQLKKEYPAPLDPYQSFALICKAVEPIGEAHLIIGGTDDEVYKGLLEGRSKSLPLSFRGTGARLMVWDNLSDVEVLKRGDEILSINGRSIAAIRAKIFEHTLCDGEIESSKDLRWIKEFSARYFWFIEQTKTFKLTYRPWQTDSVKTVELSALNHLEMVQWSQERGLRSKKRQGLEQIYSLNLQGKTAILQLRSFEETLLYDYQIEAANFYEMIFDRLRQNNIEHLIVDVRDNKGGLREFVDELLPYIMQRREKGIYRKLTHHDGTIEQRKFPKRKAKRFKGNYYVLTNGGTFSTAALIAQYLKAYAGAQIIGEETGTRYEGFSAGNYHYIVLPNSGLDIGIPNKWVQHPALPAPIRSNRGLLPDYEVKTTWESIFYEKDLVLDKAKALIQAKP